MSRQEAYQILALLQANYPDSFRGMSKEAATVKINLWEEMFADYPFKLVSAAVKAYIASNTSSFMPNIGQIMEEIDKVQNPGRMTELEAWRLVSTALRNSAYGYREEFAKLPPDIQRCVGSPEMLHEWATMAADEVQSVVASNFQRSYRTIVAKDTETRKLPKDICQLISGVAGKVVLGVGEAE